MKGPNFRCLQLHGPEHEDGGAGRSCREHAWIGNSTEKRPHPVRWGMGLNTYFAIFINFQWLFLASTRLNIYSNSGLISQDLISQILTYCLFLRAVYILSLLFLRVKQRQDWEFYFSFGFPCNGIFRLHKGHNSLSELWIILKIVDKVYH